MEMFNLFVTAMFIAVAVYLLWGFAKSRGKVKITDRNWSVARILFLVAFLLALVTVFFVENVYDIVRTVATILALGLFFFIRDGIGEEGVVTLARLIPWDQIRGYDYKENKNMFSVYFVEDNKTKSNTDYTLVMNFDLKDAEAVKELLKRCIGKKHIRIRK